MRAVPDCLGFAPETVLQMIAFRGGATTWRPRPIPPTKRHSSATTASTVAPRCFHAGDTRGAAAAARAHTGSDAPPLAARTPQPWPRRCTAAASRTRARPMAAFSLRRRRTRRRPRGGGMAAACRWPGCERKGAPLERRVVCLATHAAACDSKWPSLLQRDLSKGSLAAALSDATDACRLSTPPDCPTPSTLSALARPFPPFTP